MRVDESLPQKAGCVVMRCVRERMGVCSSERGARWRDRVALLQGEEIAR